MWLEHFRHLQQNLWCDWNVNNVFDRLDDVNDGISVFVLGKMMWMMDYKCLRQGRLCDWCDNSVCDTVGAVIDVLSVCAIG